MVFYPSIRKQATLSIQPFALGAFSLAWGMLCLPFFLSGQGQLLALEDMHQVVALSSPRISPDGQSAVFIHRTTDYENNRYVRQLMAIDIPTRQTRILVSERTGISDPQWSPDGGTLAFLASGPNGSQLFLLPVKGGEAQKATLAPGGISRYAWSPDGKRIAFIAEAEPTPAPTGAARFNDAFEVGSNDYLADEAPKARHIWVLDLGSKKSSRLTPDSITVATGLSVSSLSWSPDGRSIAFVRYASPFSGDSDLSKACLLNVADKTIRPLTLNTHLEGPVYFSPDRIHLAFGYPRDGVPANLSEVYQTGGGQEPPISRSRNLDREVLNFQWLSGGRLLLDVQDDAQSRLWIISPGGQQSIAPLGPVIDLEDWSVSSAGAMVLTGSETYRPSELYYKPSLGAAPIRLTDFNQALAAKKQGKREALTWESTHGLKPNGIVTYPPHFDPGKTYPLIVYIHGGPTASSSLGFSMQAQWMAARGWVVLEPNYRGSNNLGNAFQSAIANDAAPGPGEDVMSGVHALIEKGFIDEKRIGVSGWSYGGWMTAWMIGRYPDVWAAAMAGAAPIDYTDMYSLNDLNRMRRHAITDSPYKGDNLQAAYAQSPISNLSKIRTPTLIQSKTADARVTITGSYKLFHALRDNGVPVQFIAYPGPGHTLSDPVRAMEVWARWLGWMETYLQANRP